MNVFPLLSRERTRYWVPRSADRRAHARRAADVGNTVTQWRERAQALEGLVMVLAAVIAVLAVLAALLWSYL